MIETIEIRNFQSHEHTAFHDLSPGLNVVLGTTSDVGKSALLRALRWVIWNRPQGTAFRSHWAGREGTMVRLDLQPKDADEAVSIFRNRNDQENAYALMPWFEGGAGPQETYKTLRGEVPEPVRKVLGTGPINMQFQFDPPFLLADSPGEVAATLNRTVRLDVIDRATKTLAANRRRAEQELVSRRQEVYKKEQRLEAFVYLDEAEKLMEETESLEVVLTTTEKRIETIADASARVLKTEAECRHRRQATRAKPAIDEAVALVEEHQEMGQRTHRLGAAVNRLRSTEKQITELSARLEKTKQELKRAMPETCPMCGQTIPDKEQDHEESNRNSNS